MDEQPIVPFRAGTRPASRNLNEQGGTFAPATRAPELVHFDRRELMAILNVYGRMVAAGEWRDYAIDGLKDAAFFSVFRRASEVPLYRIEKRPRLRQRQGAYAVVTGTGLVLKRGHDLAQVLKVFETRRFQIVG
ncbi:MAG: DUF2794 domain-containing protein [Alphaproteobacteria bacterium]|nr:DUF2794 domain-containing protein [Alphaproteobacteria bacterium]